MHQEENERELNYRAAPVVVNDSGGPSTWDEKTRSVEVVGATEEPVQVWDWDRGIITEVLLMSGARMPDSRQVILLDSHNRFTTGSVIGSYREMKIEKTRMVGRIHFSSAPEAESPATKTREGHLTDFSIGYRLLKKRWIDAGQTEVIEGKTFKGPMQVGIEWVPRELSAVPIGADPNAKARSAEGKNEKDPEVSEMDEKLRKFLERRGLKESATEEEAWAFLESLGGKREEKKPEEKEDGPDLEKIRKEASDAGKKDETDRIDGIVAVCKRYGTEDMTLGLITGGKTMDQAREAVMDELKKRSEKANPGFSGIEVGITDREKFRTAALDSLCLRGNIKIEKPAPGAMELRGFSLVELARECLRMSGRSHWGRTLEMVGRAMTTDDFQYLLANVANKALFQGWETANETWSMWCGTGSVSDFKTHYSARASEASDLEEVKEDEEYNYGKRTDAQETYKIGTYGKIFSLSRQTIINDDLNALTNTPAAHGEAAARCVGDVAYAVLTANANMGDGNALFDETNHLNDAGSGYLTAPGIAAIAEAIRAMKGQTDLQGLRRLNIRPIFFIGPTAIEGATEVFFKSEKFADSNTVATDSSLAATRANPYSGNYFNRVYEPRLDDDSVTAWYLAGPKGKTVVVFFLDGIQAPYMETKQGWTVDGVEYKVRIDVGAKAMDWRGLYRNEGASD